MELIQILVFVLSLTACVASLHSCHKEENLEKEAEHYLRHHYHHIALPTQPSTVSHDCPLDLYKKDQTMKGRSISPWAYVRRDLPEHFPSTYYEAQCLCGGCIVLDEEGTPEENTNYNSKPVVQSAVFLKRVLCEGTQEGVRYRLEPVSVNVKVACTCVRPLY